MSVREVRSIGDEILKKKSKEVVELNERLKTLIVDMKDTMKLKGGCGLAACQVGVLRRIIIIWPDEKDEIITLINPKIISKSDDVNVDLEGCLSVEGKVAKVERPNEIKVAALDENMNKIEFEATGLKARIICHEIDHLEGILYVEKAVPGTIKDVRNEGEDNIEDE